MNYWEKANHSWSEDSSRVILTPSQRIRNLFFYIQEIGHFKAHIPYFTERENLPSYLIKFTLAGEGFLTYEGENYTLKAGDLFSLIVKSINGIKLLARHLGKWIGFI